MYFQRVVEAQLSPSDVAAASAWLLQSMTSSRDVVMTSLMPAAEFGFAAALRKLAQQRTTHVTSSFGHQPPPPACPQYRSVSQSNVLAGHDSAVRRRFIILRMYVSRVVRPFVAHETGSRNRAKNIYLRV